MRSRQQNCFPEIMARNIDTMLGRKLINSRSLEESASRPSGWPLHAHYEAVSLNQLNKVLGLCVRT
jgi:hypothetical protein